MFTNFLTKLGLSKPEAKVYVALLRFGEATATQLAKRTSLGRTNVYEYAASLSKNGLITEYERQGKVHYFVENPTILNDMVNLKMHQARELSFELAEIFPKLEELYNVNATRPTIKHFSGKKAKIELFDLIYLGNGAKDMFVLTNDLDDFSIPDPKYRNALLRNNVFTYLLVNKGQNIIEFNKRDQREQRRTYLVTPDTLDIATDMVIFEDKMVTGTLFGKEFVATMLQNKQLVKLLKSNLKAIIATF